MPRWFSKLAVGAVTLTLALVGSTLPVGALRATTGAPPAPAGVPASDQSNISPYPVLQRLGVWTDRAFAPVNAGAIRKGHVIVMSHGWSPGYRDSYETLQDASPNTLVTAWNPGFVNDQGVSPMTDFDTLAAALQGADPHATVLMFSWIDQSSTSGPLTNARYPEMATEVNGHRLAAALDEALAPGFIAAGGEVHLIGHSFGANIVTTASLAMTVPPRQVTLLDSPEVELARIGGAKNDLQYKLPRLNIGRGPGKTFVDNYISAVGERYGPYPGLSDIVDVRVHPPNVGESEKHTYAIVWYADSVPASNPPVGYQWSPLTGADDASLGAYYDQPAYQAPLTEVEGPPDAAVSSQLLVGAVPLAVVGNGLLPDNNDPGITLAGSGTTTWSLTFGTDGDSLWLTFDAVAHGRPGGTVTLFVDGRARYQASIPAEGAGRPGMFVILYDIAPGTHVLSAALGGPTPDVAASSTSTAALSNLRLATLGDITRNFTASETTSFLVIILVAAVALVLAVIGGAFWLLRRRRRRRAHASLDDPESDPDQVPVDESLTEADAPSVP